MRFKWINSCATLTVQDGWWQCLCQCCHNTTQDWVDWYAILALHWSAQNHTAFFSEKHHISMLQGQYEWHCMYTKHAITDSMVCNCTCTRNHLSARLCPDLLGQRLADKWFQTHWVRHNTPQTLKLNLREETLGQESDTQGRNRVKVKGGKRKALYRTGTSFFSPPALEKP